MNVTAISSSNERRIKLKLLILIDALPLVLPAAIAAFGCVSILLLLTGNLRSVYVWPLGLIAAALISAPIIRLYSKHQKDTLDRNQNKANMIVIIGVLLWVLFNIFFTAQHLFTNRDPGVYAVTATWIVRQDNLKIDGTNIFGPAHGIENTSGGFISDSANPQRIQAQGAHLLPVLLGLVGRLTSIKILFMVNVLIGGVALLALYGFARILVKPYWSILPSLMLALTLPMIYFSRDTYTEPLTLAFTFSALALILTAQKSQKNSIWLIAGIVGGAGALVRIDAYLTVACIIAFAMIMLSLNRYRKRQTFIQVIMLIFGISIGSLLGWFDVSKLSHPYYLSEWHNIKSELLLIVAIFVVGAIGVALSWGTDVLVFLDRVTNKWRAKVAGFIILGTMTFLATRQFWYVGYMSRIAIAADGTKDAIQLRNYYEQSFNWVIWYLGPLMALLGTVGLAISAGKATKRKDLFLVAPVLVVGITALFYLSRPTISPDQVWASRRLLPIILPGFIVFGTIALEKLYSFGKIRFFGANIETKQFTISIATLAVVGPLFVSWLFLFTREATWYPPVTSICDATSSKDAILWVGSARSQLIEPTKAICSIPSSGYGRLFTNNQKPSKETLEEAYINAHKSGFRPLIGLFGDEANLLDVSKENLTVISSFSFVQIEKTLRKPPTKYSTEHNTLLLGEITTTGDVVPIN